MYCRLCPANRGAIVYPCPEEPWHQLQLLSANLFPGVDISEPPANAATEVKTTARIASDDLMRFMFRSRQRVSSLVTEIGRNGRVLRPGHVMRNRLHDVSRITRTLTSFPIPILQRLERVAIELPGQSRNSCTVTSRVWAVAGCTCWNVGLGDTVVVDSFAGGHELSRSP